MNSRDIVRMAALAVGIAAVGAAADAASPTAFDTMTDHYEAIRLALVDDHTKGVSDHAERIVATAEALGRDFDPSSAEVPGAAAADCRELLPEIREAATRLAAADDLATAREAFGQLTQPLVRYRAMVEGDRPVVVYCSMAKKAWLQPEGEIGNPYFGQSMARCGEVVSD